MPSACGFLIEEMTPPPVAEMLIGVQRDPVYGATLIIGMGGVKAELLQDVATLVLPTDTDRMRAALAGLRLSALLTGYRGRPAANIDAFLDVAEKLATLILADTRIDEIEINPLMLGQDSATAVDAVIWKADPAQPDIDPELQENQDD